MLDSDLPEKRQDNTEDELRDGLAEESEGDEPSPASLTDDLTALIDDGKTYAEAELAFQKTRLSYSANQGGKAAIFGLLALGFVHLALIALVVGMVIALSPMITPIGATLLVTAILLVSALVFVRLAKRRISALIAAFDEASQ